MRNRLASIILATILALTLSPAAALAQPLASGSIEGMPAKTLTTQATAKPKMKTVYLITSAMKTETVSDGKLMYSDKPVYGKDGLLKKNTTVIRDKSGKVRSKDYASLAYKGGAISKASFTSLYAASNSSRMTKSKYSVTFPLKTSDRHNTTYTYDKAGRVASKSWESRYDENKRDSVVYKYNAKGDIVSTKTTRHRSPRDMFEARLHGIPYASDTYVNTKRWKLTYKHGRLVKATYKNAKHKASSAVTYTYKKVKVPASYAKTIERQQWALRNSNVSGSLYHDSVASWRC